MSKSCQWLQLFDKYYHISLENANKIILNEIINNED